jgi:hypothetical protein
VDVNAAHAVLSDNGTLVANTNIVVKVYINCIAVYGILNNVCHFRTARMKTFEKLKKKKSS